MSVVFLDICENMIRARNVPVTDILSIMPLASGCLVSTKSVGVVKCRQTAEQLSEKILDALKIEERKAIFNGTKTSGSD